MKRLNTRIARIEVTLFVVALIACPKVTESQSHTAQRHSTQRSQIIFVCEHGAALSVVAAAYFNKLARERHLILHAMARGTTPQKDIAVSAREGLKADGVPFETTHSQALSTSDAARAIRIVAFAPIPARYSRITRVQTWADVPPTKDNYGLARDAILKHLAELFRELERDGKAL